MIIWIALSIRSLSSSHSPRSPAVLENVFVVQWMLFLHRAAAIIAASACLVPQLLRLFLCLKRPLMFWTPPPSSKNSSEKLLEAALLLFSDVDRGELYFLGCHFFRIDVSRQSLLRKKSNSKRTFINIDELYANLRRHNSFNVVIFPKSKIFLFLL